MPAPMMMASYSATGVASGTCCFSPPVDGLSQGYPLRRRPTNPETLVCYGDFGRCPGLPGPSHYGGPVLKTAQQRLFAIRGGQTMTDLPKKVEIHEEGPREGFQIEPGPI